jgi:hypothetical protein
LTPKVSDVAPFSHLLFDTVGSFSTASYLFLLLLSTGVSDIGFNSLAVRNPVSQQTVSPSVPVVSLAKKSVTSLWHFTGRCRDGNSI